MARLKTKIDVRATVDSLKARESIGIPMSAMTLNGVTTLLNKICNGPYSDMYKVESDKEKLQFTVTRLK